MEAFFNRPGVRRALRLAATLILPALLLAVRPLDMSVRQGGVLAALVLVITWWVTGVVERTAASLVLLAVFLLIGGAPARTVFSFPLSQNFLMIVFSFLFSQGISNSGWPPGCLSRCCAAGRGRRDG
jgi:di/tricarboxylate transporter